MSIDIREFTDNIVMDEKQKLAKNIRDYVKLSDKKPVDIAEKMGIHHSVLYDYMNGNHVPNALIIKKLRKVLGCEYEDILD